MKGINDETMNSAINENQGSPSPAVLPVILI